MQSYHSDEVGIKLDYYRLLCYSKVGLGLAHQGICIYKCDAGSFESVRKSEFVKGGY